MSTNVLRIVYCSLVESHLRYGLIVWGNSAKYLLKPLLILQKKAIRYVSKKPYNYPTAGLFDSLNVYTLSELYKVSLLKLMHKFHHNKLPLSLQSLFITNRQVHNYNTRNVNAPHMYKMKKTCYYCSFMYQAPNLWMRVPTDTRVVKSLKVITKKV